VLLENALLYSPDDGIVTVGLCTGRASARVPALKAEKAKAMAVILPGQFTRDEAVTEIWVQDQGHGIPPEHLARIFQRFTRVDTSLTREVNGLGLGLTLGKYIVELHRGRLWVESMPGVGSTFHIVLPQEALLTVG
jgi:signal transduction histidine kinase